MDKGCHQEVELEVKRIREKEGVDERLKTENPVKRMRRENEIKMNVEGEVEVDDFYNSTYRNTVYMSNCVEGKKLIFILICDSIIQI